MAKRIDEVWYAYNAKGIKIPPYKSRITKKVNNSLLGRIWQTVKENWSSIIISILGLFIVGFMLLFTLHLILS